MYIDEFDKFIGMTPYLEIGPDDWSRIKETYEMEDVLESLATVLMTYPLPYNEIDIEDAKKEFMKLKRLNWQDYLVHGNWSARHEYEEPLEYDGEGAYFRRINIGNDASNYFQQRNRWAVDATQSPGPERTWRTLRSMKSVCKAFYTMDYESIHKGSVRSALSLRKYICSQFKPSVAKMMYEMFEAETVLDFSAGWGDRLAGFYAAMCTRTYIGIDPRSENHPIYREQKEFYDRQLGWFEEEKDVYFYESPAEEWDNIEWIGKVDFIFTSPPYFNTERYSYDDTQSWVRYKDIDSWNEQFLHKALENVWATLKSGGYMVINIADIYDRSLVSYVKICDPMIEFMKSKSDCSYEGVIGMELAARPNDTGIDSSTVFAEPMWVFRKL